MSELTDQITDVIFTEATRIVLEDTDDETVQRVAAIMSMCSKRLAEKVADALQLTEEVAYRHRCNEPGKTAADCDVPERRWVSSWSVEEQQP